MGAFPRYLNLIDDRVNNKNFHETMIMIRDVFKKQKPARIKLLDEGDGARSSGRRAFLRAMAAKGVLIPAAYVMCRAATDPGTLASEAHAAAPAASDSTGAGATHAARVGEARIVRDFADPYLELIRLLREASEVEHSLMLQYLYGAFSLKPAYHSIAGYGNPNANDLLGVAIQEMQHLAAVNRLLVALGAAPHLVREDFPYEPEIYPFEFHLEPLSVASLAKYVYCEAPFDATDPSHAKTKEDSAFQQRLFKALAGDTRPNHIGSLYSSIIATLDEVRAAPLPDLPDMKPWIDKLVEIKDQGERDHYEFFRRVFMGTHQGFNGHPDVWALEPDDAAYPVLALAANPSAYQPNPRPGGAGNRLAREPALLDGLDSVRSRLSHWFVHLHRSGQTAHARAGVDPGASSPQIRGGPAVRSAVQRLRTGSQPRRYAAHHRVHARRSGRAHAEPGGSPAGRVSSGHRARVHRSSESRNQAGTQPPRLSPRIATKRQPMERFWKKCSDASRSRLASSSRLPSLWRP
jgi:Ferritin-like